MNVSKLKLLGAMGIFGTVGIFVRAIPMSSAAIAFSRGVMGLLFLLVLMALTGKRLSGTDIRRNILVLCLSGMAIGGNWVLLFEAYRYTTVATATVCYYLAPVFVLLASPLLGERLTARKLVCIAVAMAGAVCVSGVLRGGVPARSELLGVLFGVGAAMLYATVILLNKKLRQMGAYDKTVLQLAFAAAVILPYLLLTEGLSVPDMKVSGWGLLAVVGIVHTGAAYALYFDSMRGLSAQTVALFSYLDPVIAVLLSALMLKEPMDGYGVLGAVLILGSALYSELPERNRKAEKIRKRA